MFSGIDLIPMGRGVQPSIIARYLGSPNSGQSSLFFYANDSSMKAEETLTKVSKKLPLPQAYG